MLKVYPEYTQQILIYTKITKIVEITGAAEVNRTPDPVITN